MEPKRDGGTSRESGSSEEDDWGEEGGGLGAGERRAKEPVGVEAVEEKQQTEKRKELRAERQVESER
ncbi:unnamed protein product [Lampetra planeri]